MSRVAPPIHRAIRTLSTTAPARSSSLLTSQGRQQPAPSKPDSIRPLMQGFHTSPSPRLASPAPTIDHFFFPAMDVAPLNPFARLRVPLLPDNYSPDRSPGGAHAPEAPAPAPPRAAICVVAALPHDAAVVVSSLTGVVAEVGEMTMAEMTRAFGGVWAGTAPAEVAMA